MWFGRLRSRSCRVPMMGWPQRQIRNRCFWAESIGSMAFPAAASRLGAIGAPMALSPTERDLPDGRGGLSASQRADVMGLAQTWLREGTGTIIADVPVGTPNARAAADALRQVRSLLAAAGVPPRVIVVRRYQPDDLRTFATIRLSYPKISAIAGPCGLWPEDLGPSIRNPSYFENKSY